MPADCRPELSPCEAGLLASGSGVWTKQQYTCGRAKVGPCLTDAAPEAAPEVPLANEPLRRSPNAYPGVSFRTASTGTEPR